MKKMKLIHVLLMSIILFGLTGCFKKEAPACSDAQIEQMVKQIYIKHINEVGNTNVIAQMLLMSVPKKIVDIQSARPVAYDEKISLRSCKAEAVFENNVTSPIEYTTQINTENEDEIFVELKLDFLENLAQQGMMDHLMKDL